jgi:ParB family transcriptional regulator, chromosome partitioning protein
VDSAPPRRGLGQGLALLLGEPQSGAQGSLRDIPIDQITPNPRQPRARIDEERFAELVESVRQDGIVQPVLVRGVGAGWELIAGERRWRAARAAGLATIPALVRETDDRDSLLLALVENVAREDLSPIEEARAYSVLMDEFTLSLGDVAERVGRSKPTVSNRMRLLELPEDVIGLLERGLISEGHARAILAVPGHDERRALARQVVRKGLTVRATERAARWAGARTKPRRARRISPALASRARSAMEGIVGSGVRVTDTRIEIPFTDETQLEEIIESLERARA